jgi:hypothetical protein
MNKGQKFTSSLGNIVNGAIEVNGYSLKLHFCVFERSQGKHNSLDYHFFFEIFLYFVKFTCSKLDTNFLKIAFSKYSSLECGQSFFHMSYQICTNPFRN